MRVQADSLQLLSQGTQSQASGIQQLYSLTITRNATIPVPVPTPPSAEPVYNPNQQLYQKLDIAGGCLTAIFVAISVLCLVKARRARRAAAQKELV